MLKTCVLMAGSSLLVLATGVSAQTVPTPPSASNTGVQPSPSATPTPPEQVPVSNAEPAPDSSVAHPQDTANTSSNTGDVVVTGSRTIRNGNSSPSPVTVVSTQDVLRARPGGTLSDALSTLPVFAGSRGAASNPSTTGSQAAGNGSANQLNLRNLGANRTLVLLDGNRVPPTTANGIVDADIIPQLLVQRVDTVTGGVSAVYGSDAVSGVVNFVLDRKFTGVSVTASDGISERGDARRTDLGIAAGMGLFGGRGHVEASYEYIDNGGILNRSSRDWLQQVGVTGAGTTANPYVLNTNVRRATLPFGGLITNGVLTGQTFGSDGVLRTFVHGAATGTSGLEIGGDGGYYDSSLIAPLRAHQVFGRFDFDVSDAIHFYAQASVDLKTNESYSDLIAVTNYTFSATNPFLPVAYQNQLKAAGQTTFRLSELINDLPRLDARSHSNQQLYMAGFTGSLGKFQWGANYTHGATVLDATLLTNPNIQRLTAALDVTTDASGNIVCRSTLTGNNPGCVPINILGPTAVSQAAANYVTQPTHYHTVTKLDDVSAHIEGSPFNTWAGPLNVALSGEYRKLSFYATSDARPSDAVNCTGILYNCTAGAALYSFTFPDTPLVSQQVTEGAVEVTVPLLKDVPFIQEFSVNGAARYTHYNTSGNYWTWKFGLDWHITDTLRLRGTHSRDIRAPTLYELFSPTATVPVNPTDLLTGLSPAVLEYDPSNPNLQAEIGSTTTAGVVWTPTRKFSIALDYYHIKLSSAIVQITGSSPGIQQACYASGGTSPFCALQSRPLGFTNTTAANAVTAWYSAFLNIGEIRTEGADLEVNYSTSLFDRPASIRVLGDYQPHVYYVTPGSTTLDQGDVAFGPLGLSAGPSLRLSAFLRFQPVPHFTIDIFEKWRNSLKLSGDPTLVVADNHIAPFATTSLTFTYDFESSLAKGQFFINVSNLFDADPPIGAYTGNGTRSGLRDGFALGDDPTGRNFTAGVRLKF